MSCHNSNKKPKRVVLSIHDKAEILDRLKNGKTATLLSREYNMGKATICTIMNNTEKILQFQAATLVNATCSKNKKIISSAENIIIEDAIYLWFIQQRAIGEPINGLILCEKALQLNERMNGDANFRANNGWLKNFKKKKRHGVRLLNIQGEKLSLNMRKALYKNYIQNFMPI
ncbi:jerky protein homolog-like [Frieseomelitta varia]|uniref:jerky protein homolog-like n=1 Tax=Frieseomelitta varia TaxID=561572 RepID=UPI001CB69448|nr:jerky protein homolog-like [Frieseomelitta varia]